MGGVIHPLHQVDLLTPAERKITEKEYWAQRRGQEKLDELNQKMKEDGITPKETRYQTEKQFLRDAIDDAASIARSPEEFSKIEDHLKMYIAFFISEKELEFIHNYGCEEFENLLESSKADIINLNRESIV